MRLFVHYSFETCSSLCQIRFPCHCYRKVFCETSPWGVNTAVHWRWQAVCCGLIAVAWPGALPSSMLQKEREGGRMGRTSLGSLVSRRASLVASVPSLPLPWHWWTSLCVARSMPHSTNLGLPHLRGRAMHHHKASSSRGERLEKSH